MVKREVESAWCDKCGHERLFHLSSGCEAGYPWKHLACGCQDFVAKKVMVSTFEVDDEWLVEADDE